MKDVSYTPEQRAEKRQEIDRLMQAIHPIVARADTPRGPASAGARTTLVACREGRHDLPSGGRLLRDRPPPLRGGWEAKKRSSDHSACCPSRAGARVRSAVRTPRDVTTFP